MGVTYIDRYEEELQSVWHMQRKRERNCEIIWRSNREPKIEKEDRREG